MCKEFTDEQRIDFMNFIKKYMKDKVNFSTYFIFCDFRDAYDLYIRYSDVRDEVRDIVRNVVDEIGGYDKEYVNENGIVYLEYFPIEDDEETFDEYTNENVDDEEDYYKDFDNDNDKLIYNINLSIDSKGRVFIPIKAVKDAKIGQTIYVIDNRKNDNSIILTSNELVIYDKVINGSINGGFHVSVGKYFKGKTKLTAEVDEKSEEIILK